MIYITLDILPLLGEKTLEILGERFPTLRNPVASPALETEDLVHAVCIDRPVGNLIEDTQITADAIEGAAGLQSADDMHPRVERDTRAGKRLQTAAQMRTALQHGDPIALLGKQRGREKSADAAADDMHLL